MRALVTFQLGSRAARALCLIGLLIALGGAGWTQLNERGKAAYARGDYTEAERLFRQALAAAPDEPELHYHRAVALTHLHRWAEAAAAYEKSLALRPPPALAAAARQGLRSVEPLARPRVTVPPVPEPVAAPPRARRPQLPPETVPVRRVGGNWVVDVVLNDAQAATFLVDTGASACAITPELAESLGITPDPNTPPVRVRGVGGDVWGRLVKIPAIRVGDMEAHDVMAFVVPLPGLQGILGNTFLSRYTATLDPGQGQLTLRPR
jgi:clan AA aspartic protease (TIGR02281 family)